MNKTETRLLAGLMGLSLLAAISLKATPVTVEEVGVGPNETAWIDSSTLGNNLHVYACVIDLKVNGVATTGFCIDPWHWSVPGPLAYNTESLDTAPKPPGPMGMAAANQIEQLWEKYYSGPLTNVVAAALQIEIWKIVDLGVSSATFQLLSVDNDSAAVYAKMTEMENFLSANPHAAKANLIAVTGRGQDYVIQVPDGGTTVALLGMGLIGLIAFRKKLFAA
jgi:hypothetical protein